MINDTTARTLAEARHLAGHPGQPRARPADACGARHDDEFVRLPTATPVLWPRFAGVAADHSQRLLMPGGHRPRSLPHRGVARHRQPGWPVCSSSCRRSTYRLFGFFDLAFLVPELLLLLVAINSASGSRPRSPRAQGRWGGAARCAGSPSRCSSSAAPRRPSWSTSGSSARSRRPTSRPPRTISCSARSARRPQKGCRTGSGSCCHGCFRTCCQRPAATPRSGLSPRTATRCRSAFRSVTVGFPRVGINCAMCHAASYRHGRTSRRLSSPRARRIRRRRSSTSGSSSTPPPIRASTPIRCWRRSHATPGCRSSTACSIASRSFPRHAAPCCSSATRKAAGCARGPTGVAAVSTPSIR